MRRDKKSARDGRKRYAESFKISVVEELSSGKYSQAEVQRRHGISSSGTISAWVRKYGKIGQVQLSNNSRSRGSMTKKQSIPNQNEQDMATEIKRLKKELREIQVKNLVHETMLEIIDEDYGLDKIKKKLNIEQLSDYESEIIKMYKL